MALPYIYYDFYETNKRRHGPVYWCQSSLSAYNRELLSPDVLLKYWCQVCEYEVFPSNRSSGMYLI